MRNTVIIVPQALIPAVFQATRDYWLPSTRRYAAQMGNTPESYWQTAGQILALDTSWPLSVNEFKEFLTT